MVIAKGTKILVFIIVIVILGFLQISAQAVSPGDSASGSFITFLQIKYLFQGKNKWNLMS